ncbi:MAG TPA: hybrid sensor histidine kinase/response regulator [Polyangiaceae bacterium]|nr:hybrid sensor histidine kinase/response regulator [Polyangiaceae bacterium]
MNNRPAGTDHRGAPEGFAGDSCGDVLIVDDFPDTLALYESMLSENGHRVRVATNGVDALRQVEEREPELVLLDVSMPGLDGVEVLRRLRARPGAGPAVIMLTAARREPHAIEAGLKEGADAYLTKPIDSRELLARVRAALETFRLRRMLDAQRRDHVAMLVHDLRHPLSSLGLLAEVLEADDMDAHDRESAVSQMRTLCSEMARLVDSVLAASRLEAGVFSVEPRTVRVGAIVEPTLAVFTPVASRRRVALTFEGSLALEVYADPQKLRQALDNLVANAVKFTPRGGRIVVRVSSDGRQTIFEITDSGPGVAEGERGTIFDRYKQGSRGRAAGGAGLGLTIARGIAEAHHGSVSVTTGDLGGAAFRIALPSRASGGVQLSASDPD